MTDGLLLQRLHCHFVNYMHAANWMNGPFMPADPVV